MGYDHVFTKYCLNLAFFLQKRVKIGNFLRKSMPLDAWTVICLRLCKKGFRKSLQKCSKTMLEKFFSNMYFYFIFFIFWNLKVFLFGLFWKYTSDTKSWIQRFPENFTAAILVMESEPRREPHYTICEWVSEPA